MDEVEREMRQRIEQALAAGFAFFGEDNDYPFSIAEQALAEMKADWLRRHPDRAHRRTKAKIPRWLARKVFERDQYRCVICGDWRDLAADHITPESKGGSTTIENLQTLCRSCNSRKGARQPEAV